MIRYILITLCLCCVAFGAATDVTILQRDDSNRNTERTITGSSNLWEAVGFNASGVLTSITLWNMTPSSGRTAGKILGVNSGATDLEWLSGVSVTDGDKGDITVASTGTSWTIDADSVALGTDTTGNYVATIADAGSGEFTVTGSGAEGAGVTLGIAGVSASKISSGTLSAARLPTPGTATLGGVMRNAGTAGQYVSGIDNTGALVYGTPAGGGDVTKVGTPVANQIGYWTGDGTLAGNSALTFDSGTGTISVTNFNTTNFSVTNVSSAFTQKVLDNVGTTQGQIAYFNGTDWVALSPGTSGQVLQTQGSGANPQWANASSGSVATDAIYDAKGDLPVGTGANTSAKLSVGTNGQVLTADSAEATGVKWATPSASGPTISGNRQNVLIWDEFFYNGYSTSAPAGPFGWVVTAANGGSRSVATNSTTENTAPGNVELSITTTASSATGFPSGNTILLGAGTYKYESRILIKNLAVTTSEEYTYRNGIMDSTTAEPADGCYFRYSQADASWIAVCRSNSTETSSATDTAVDVVANTWYKLTVEVNAAASSVVFKINDTTVRTETANIPSGTGRQTGVGISMIRSAGAGTATVYSYIDYVGLEIGFTSSR